MPRKRLRDEQWQRIKEVVPGKVTDSGVTAKDNRLFVEALLWIARTGSRWRDLPPALGDWHATYTRFSPWGKKCVCQHVIEAIRDDVDLEVLFVESTVVRAQQHAAGAQKKKARGLSTKIHAMVDGQGNPLRWILTGGEVADVTQAPALIEGFDAQTAIADKGYDGNAFAALINAASAAEVFPPRSNRTEPRAYDRHLYKDRNLVERFFNRLKQFRCIATRYEKHARTLLPCPISYAPKSG